MYVYLLDDHAINISSSSYFFFFSNKIRFNADMDWRTRGEDDIHNGNLIGTGGNMRRKDAGIFRGNKAHSCYYQGFRFYNFEQFFKHRNLIDVPIFENTMAYRNREHGIYTYSKWGGSNLCSMCS